DGWRSVPAPPAHPSQGHAGDRALRRRSVGARGRAERGRERLPRQADPAQRGAQGGHAAPDPCMMRRALGLALLLAGAPVAADELHFKEHGFSIKALPGHSDAQTQQVVILLLPVSDGFAANVNVQVQPFAGSIDEYLKISLDQFKTM